MLVGSMGAATNLSNVTAQQSQAESYARRLAELVRLPSFTTTCDSDSLETEYTNTLRTALGAGTANDVRLTDFSFDVVKATWTNDPNLATNGTDPSNWKRELVPGERRLALVAADSRVRHRRQESRLPGRSHAVAKRLRDRDGPEASDAVIARMRQRADRNETGITTLIVMVAVIVIATVFSAVLNLQTSTMKGTAEFQAKRDRALAADAAIDASIAQIQSNLQIGVAGTGTDCASSTTSAALSQYPAYHDPQFGDMTVRCKSLYAWGGGYDTHLVGKPADNVLLALGGSWSKGFFSGGGGNQDSPFCDDAYNTSGTCEVGVYVGHGPSNNESVTVGKNGSVAGKPTVVSNGSIVADTSGPRYLNVKGDVKGRGYCIDIINTGYTKSCPSTLTALSSKGDFTPDPWWKHESWTVVDRTATPRNSNGIPVDGSNVPLASPPAETPLDMPWTKWDNADPNRAASVSKDKIDLICQDGFVDFKPGTYTDLQPLNWLMGKCPQTTYWFEPGTYYFDFTDVGDKNITWTNATTYAAYWTEPLNFSEFVGGTAKGWTPCTSSCTGIAQATEKVMRPESLDLQSAWGTVSGGAVTDNNLIDTNITHFKLDDPAPAKNEERFGMDGVGLFSQSPPRCTRRSSRPTSSRPSRCASPSRTRAAT